MMSLEFSHKPNYFLFAQLLIRYVQQQVSKTPTAQLEIPTDTLKTLFREDTAAVTTNLESILNIADEYKVETINGDEKIIQSYSIEPGHHMLVLNLSPDAVTSLNNGHPLIEPNSSSYI